jgi:hypothetical protein
MRDPARLLIDAFSTLTRTIPADEVLFGSPSLQTAGICDGTQGVQWNAGIKWDGARQMAYAGVNLEGLVYRDWPVARLIERELDAPQLPSAKDRIADAASVQVLWFRDAWQVAARPPVREKLIAPSPLPLHALTDVIWTDMLREAYDCLDPARGHRARGQQKLTLSSGKRKVFSVSPHLLLRQPFWPKDPQRLQGWRASLDEAMANLRPLHQLVTALAR